MEKNTLYLTLLTILVSCSLIHSVYSSEYHPPNDSVVWDVFNHWKDSFGKVYGDAENQERFQTFKQNYHYIHS